jgi:anthranilate phosphoribosyltransferase
MVATVSTRSAPRARHASPSSNEVSPQGPTRVTQLDGDSITEFEIEPADFGVKPRSLDSIGGGDAAHNAAALISVLGGEDHPATPAIVLNAAAALVVSEGLSPKSAGARAEHAITSGAARQTLERWRKAALAAKG